MFDNSVIRFLIPLLAFLSCSSSKHIAVPGEFGHMVTIKYDSTYCSGAIIANRFVVVAAHCLDNKENIRSEMLIAGKTNKQSTELKFGILQIHPLDERAVIIELEKPFEFNDPNVSNILIATPSDSKEICIVVGWEHTDLDERIVYELFESDLKGALSKNNFCGEQVLCDGKLVGIISNNGGCNKFEHYTDLHEYSRPIHSIISSNKYVDKKYNVLDVVTLASIICALFILAKLQHKNEISTTTENLFATIKKTLDIVFVILDSLFFIITIFLFIFNDLYPIFAILYIIINYLKPGTNEQSISDYDLDVGYDSPWPYYCGVCFFGLFVRLSDDEIMEKRTLHLSKKHNKIQFSFPIY